MRVLFFSHYYPPEVNAPASRTSDHCRAWAAAGHDVVVVTCAPNHPAGRVYHGYANRLWQTERIDGVTVHRVWTFLAANEGFSRRILNYTSYLVAVTLALPRLPLPDVIVTTSPQLFCGLAGLPARWAKRVPWVLEIRDLWPESILSVGAMRRGTAIRMLEYLESLAYRRADYIVAVTDAFVPHIAVRGGASKTSVIKNGVDLSLFRRGTDADAFKRRIGFADRFVAAYVGTHGMAHGLDTLLDAAKLLREEPRIGFILVGDGAERARLAARVDAEGLTNVRVVGQLPKADMPAVWAATDASVILLRRTDAFTKVLPSKLFEAMAMQCPVVLGVEGEAKDLLDAAGAGIAIEPENAEALAAAVLQLANDREAGVRFGANGLAHVRAHYDRSVLAARMLDILDSVARTHRDVRPVGTTASFLQRAFRAWSFARHIPARNMLRRATLSLRRRWLDVVGERHRADVAPPRAARLPSPLLAPRTYLAPLHDSDAWTFRFLHRTVTMPGPSIDWTAPGSGPVDQLWRMNLHYMEWLEALDDETFCSAMLDWIDSNGEPRRGAWRDSWNSYTLSLRVVVWMTEAARRGPTIASISDALDRSLARQVRFLFLNLETDLGGNHLVKNITALIWAAHFFSGPEADHWQRHALGLLDRELARQVLPDGVHYERSPSYHAQVFTDLLACRHVLGGDPLGGRLDDALHRMAQACADLAHPDGAVAQLNDAGLTMAPSPVDCLAAYEETFGSVPLSQKVFGFRDAGLFGLRHDGTYCIVDCGRVAPNDLPAHGHGDILSFELSVAGCRIVVDQGVFEYSAGPKREQSRAARNHNTLCLTGVDQADFYGAFRCGRRPDVSIHRWEPSASGFVLEGSHDGFAHLPGRPRHRRCFDVSPEDIAIRDTIEGHTDRAGRISFLLHPDVIVTRTGETLTLRHADAELCLTCSAPLTIEPAVWWPDMGVECATQRVVAVLAPGETDLSSRLTIVRPDANQGLAA